MSQRLVPGTDQVRLQPDGEVRLGTDANYTAVEPQGFVEYNGEAGYWVDIDFPIIIRTTGAGIPSLATLSGNITCPQWQVNDFNVCESQELIHAWQEGSTCYWHIHLTTNGSDVDNRYVRFEIEYGYNNGQGTAWTFPPAADSGDLLIPAGTADRTMYILSLANFTPASAKIGGHVIARLKRIASAGTAPTSDPFIPMLQMHVLCNTAGSREVASK